MTRYAISTTSLIDKLTDEKLLALSSENPDMRFERNAEGKLIIMPPTGSNTSKNNSSLLAQIWNWNNKYKLGEVFDSSGGFRLSNGAIRSPDVSWVKSSRWKILSEQEKEVFAPIAPDFVLELMSKSDNLRDAQEKMAEYLNCGVKFGWLIIPRQKQVEIYRQGKDKEVLKNPSSLSGEDVMPDLLINLSEILQ